MKLIELMPLLARGEEGFFVVAIVVALGIALAIRLLAGTLDHDRIRQYVQQRGGSVRSIQWSPFGHGWFGDKHHRIYEVAYDDADGNPHVATCKTSLWSGVYWTEDQVAGRQPFARLPRPPANVFEDPAQLAAENQRLHEEVQRLKQELKHRG
ncbi:MAG TPA: hypothetical protein VFB80_04480 [Pirellulaceae bacterium]|nr:hypothetical protein [Pirellulaceae bacterium]